MNISDNQKKILSLLADGEFHSGTELAEALGLSRSAVWKQVNGLVELGLSHSAVSGKGYRLDKSLELLDASKINEVVDKQVAALISSFEIHDQIDSTNRYLVERAQHNAPSGAVCFAEHQTAGKGRRGRQWVSPYGCNIYLSILWRFQQGPAAISGLSLAIGVAVIRAIYAAAVKCLSQNRRRRKAISQYVFATGNPFNAMLAKNGDRLFTHTPF